MDIQVGNISDMLQGMGDSEASSKKKVLVVDDDQKLVKLLDRALTHFGFDFLKAGSVAEAMNVISQDTEIDIVLLDWMMPDMNGLVVLQKIKKINQGLSVVMLTVKNKPDEVMTAMEYGAADYIIKPMDKDDLIFKIKNMLHIGEYEPRERTSPRRKIVMQAFTSLMISHIDPKKICFASTFPIESGSLVFVYSSDLNEALDIEREKRFSVKVGSSQGYGNHHMICAQFYSLAPDVLERIGKVYG